MTIKTPQNPIEQAKVLDRARYELSQDLLEQAHEIIKTLLELPPSQHDRLGAYKPLLVPLFAAYLQHARAFDLLEQSAQDAPSTLHAPLLTLAKQLDTLALEVLAVVTKKPPS